MTRIKRLRSGRPPQGAMHCPHCGHPDTSVIDSRSTALGKSVRRRRECNSCGERASSYELWSTRIEEYEARIAALETEKRETEQLRVTLSNLLRDAKAVTMEGERE